MESQVLYDDFRRTDQEDVDGEDADSESVDSEEFDKEELEIALYSQIHFETNDVLESQETLQEDDITDNFIIDVEGNDKTGFQAELKTADYIVNERINTESDTKLQNNFLALTDRNKNKTGLTKHRKTVSVSKSIDSITPDKITIIENALEAVQNRKRPKSENKGLAEKLILDTGSSSGTEKSDDSSDVSESMSEHDLIDLDIESQEENNDIYVNVEKNQQSLMMKTAGGEWNVGVNDVHQYNSSFRRPRYYKPINICCRNCDEMGHLSKNCPKPKKEQTCALCSEVGHFAKICPDAFCYNCEEPGHIAKDCTYPKRSWYTTCTRCRMQGHRKYKCPDQWRQYHITFEGTKLMRGKKRRLLKKATCYNCAADDHLGHECEEDRMDRYSRPSNPFICKYLPVEYDYYSRDTTEYPSPKVSDTVSNTDREKKRVSQFVINKTQPESTGRNNFDRLQFSSNIYATQSEHSKDEFKKPKGKKKQKKVVKTETDTTKTGNKRKLKNDDDRKTKRQKIMDTAEKNDEKDFPKKAKKKSNKSDSNKEAKRQKRTEIAGNSKSDSGFVIKTSKDSMKTQDKFEKANKLKEIKKKSEISDKQVRGVSQIHYTSSKKFTAKKDTITKGRPGSKTDAYYDDIQVTFGKKDLKEERFPRGGKTKPDSYCDEIHVTFANNLCTTPDASHSKKGKAKKVVKSDSLAGTEEAKDDHQVFHNEWWADEKPRGKKRRRKNKGNKKAL